LFRAQLRSKQLIQNNKKSSSKLNHSALWWKGCVIYQVYCRSFYDANNDGIGDLNGVTLKLDYIKSIGVDAIWLTPFFKSPMLDMGYDVEDHIEVDPLFGSMKDFDELLLKAHKVGLKVMIDLVLSHTSDQHSWFKESSSDANNSKSDWYVWADPKDDGAEPNNWLSLFGGSAWKWSDTRKQYYLHNFLESQPDLNFHSEEVQKAQLEVIDFWCKKGVDGFRFDTVNFYFHDKKLRNNPKLKNATQNLTVPGVNPYGMLEHLYDKSQPESLEFFKKIRLLLNQYEGLASLGELGEENEKCFELMEEYTSGNDYLNMCYAFDLLGGQLSSKKIKDYLNSIDKLSPNAWYCNSYSNHDVIRHLSRWTYNKDYREQYAIMTLNLLLALKGTVCLYQGEELGLLEGDIVFEELKDPYGIAFWPHFSGRDGCRTPMPWEANGKHLGFSTHEPWLPTQNKHKDYAIDLQQKDSNSMLNQYIYWINLRKLNPSLIEGTLDILNSREELIVFQRTLNNTQTICVFNLSDKDEIYITNSDNLDSDFIGQNCRFENDTFHLTTYGFGLLSLTNRE